MTEDVFHIRTPADVEASASSGARTYIFEPGFMNPSRPLPLWRRRFRVEKPHFAKIVVGYRMDAFLHPMFRPNRMLWSHEKALFELVDRLCSGSVRNAVFMLSPDNWADVAFYLDLSSELLAYEDGDTDGLSYLMRFFSLPDDLAKRLPLPLPAGYGNGRGSKLGYGASDKMLRWTAVWNPAYSEFDLTSFKKIAIAHAARYGKGCKDEMEQQVRCMEDIAGGGFGTGINDHRMDAPSSNDEFPGTVYDTDSGGWPIAFCVTLGNAKISVAPSNAIVEQLIADRVLKCHATGDTESKLHQGAVVHLVEVKGVSDIKKSKKDNYGIIVLIDGGAEHKATLLNFMMFCAVLVASAGSGQGLAYSAKDGVEFNGDLEFLKQLFKNRGTSPQVSIDRAFENVLKGIKPVGHGPASAIDYIRTHILGRPANERRPKGILHDKASNVNMHFSEDFIKAIDKKLPFIDDDMLNAIFSQLIQRLKVPSDATSTSSPALSA